jgi:hypothetical protein
MIKFPRASTRAREPGGTSVVEEYSVTTHGARKRWPSRKSSRR